MARRRENMLEAFKASAERPPVQPQKGVARQPGQGIPVGAPRAPRDQGAPPQGRPPAQRPPVGPPSEAAGLNLPIGAATFVLLQVVVLASAFFLGRLSHENRVEAAGDDRGSSAGIDLREPSGTGRLQDASLGQPGRNPAQGGPGAQPGGGAPAAVDNPADDAFLAAENKFTVLVCTYDDTEYGRDRAWEAFEHLRTSGFAAVTPRRQNGRLFLFVGASGSYKALETLEKDLKRTPGPGGKRQPFRDAFRVNIEDYL